MKKQLLFLLSILLCMTVVGVLYGGEPSESAVLVLGHRPDGTRSKLSGAIIGTDGKQAWVLTNWHLFRDPVARVQVSPPNHGRWYQARVVGSDEPSDLALLQFETAQPVVALPLAETPAQTAERVTLLGYPLTRNVPLPRAGTLQPTQYESGAQEFSMTCWSGDSGAPLVNARGQLVAINWGGDGHSYATPVNQIRHVLETKFCRNGSCQIWRPLTPIQKPPANRPAPVAPAPVAPPPVVVGAGQPGASGTQPQPPIAIDYDKLADKVAARIELIRGEPGPPGARGRDGRDGTTPAIDYDHLTAEVLGRLPPVKLQIKQPDGSLDQQAKPLGQPITLKLFPERN